MLAAVSAAALVALVAVVVTTLRSNPTPTELAGNSVALLDIESGELLDQIAVGDRPGDIAFGRGSVWVVNSGDGSVSRIDTEARSIVDTIPVGADPLGIVLGHGSVWVSKGTDGSLLRIDPDSGEVVQTISVGSGPSGIAIGHGSVWVANRLEDTVSRVDGESGAIQATIDVGDGPSELAVDEDAVWVSNQFEGSLSKISPQSNTVTDQIGVGNAPLAIAVADSGLWVVNSLDETVSRIGLNEPHSVTETIRVGTGPSSLSAGSGVVWVTNESDATITKIDTASNEVIETIHMAAPPVLAATGGGGLWVSAADTVGSHLGGTLTVIRAVLPSIDPHNAYSPWEWEILSLTNDGLVDFKRVGGAEGATLVPNLAESIPVPTDGGKSYTFHLREGLRYSTGDPVRASDVRRSLERTLLLQVAPAYFFNGIVGSSSCTKPATCDLSRGVVTDDAEGTATISLKQPDPQFLHKLAVPLAYVLPLKATDGITGTRPLPATGPYMIASYKPRDQLELVRNPFFRPGADGSQPGGNADEIVVRLDVKPDAAVDQIVSGGADSGSEFANPDRLEELRGRYPDQLHFEVTMETHYMVLNTRIPPFNDLRVRRALNYAVDRERVVEIYGGPERSALTCQALPPTLSGYERYCPYSSNPSRNGKWTAPDLARARQLVRESSTMGTKVKVWAVRGLPPHRALAAYFVSLLNELGYKAKSKVIDITDVPLAYDSRNRVQIFPNGWVADYPAPATFVEPLFTCDSFLPANVNNSNPSGFCDPRIDSLVAQANELQASDPPEARKLWAKIDAEIVDQAPAVFLYNPRIAQLVSARTGNYQFHPMWGLLLDQLWVE